MDHRPDASRLSRIGSCLAFVVGTLLTRPGIAQQLVALHGSLVTPAEAAAYREAPRPAAAPEYGTTGTSSYMLGPCDGAFRVSTYPYTATECDIVTSVLPGPTLGAVGFPIHLPAGALITSITLNYYNTDPNGQPSAGLYAIPPTGVGGFVIDLSPAPFTGGNATVTFPLVPAFQVDNSLVTVIKLVLSATDGSQYNGVYGFEVHYKLQVSPAPATATFTDVATDNPFFQYVEALAASGVTGGCGVGIYCPNNPVTRGQMAVFLSKALGLYFPN
jgi:hypothetical protein